MWHPQNRIGYQKIHIQHSQIPIIISVSKKYTEKMMHVVYKL